MTLVVAHRGAAADAPENTMPAFRLAVEQGADAIELDLRLSSDGELVVMHDPEMDRTTDRAGTVASLTLPQIREADAGFGFEAVYGSFPFRGQGVRVPTLGEVLEWLPDGIGLVVEVKALEAAAPAVAALRGTRARVAATFSLISFDERSIDEAHRLDPGLSTGYLLVPSQALEPAKNVDEAKLADALGKMVRDDPTLRCKTDQETGQLILSGMGELHLEVAVHKLQRDHRVQVTVGKPMVSYRQTLSRSIELEYRYIKQTGGRGQYAVIDLKLEPLTKEEREAFEAELAEEGDKPDRNGLYFVDDIVGGAVPGEYIPAVEKGFRAAAQRGGKFPFQCIDIRCRLVDGKAHDVDSSQMAFQRATEEAFTEATKRAGMTLLEPIMEVQVQAPGQYIGDLTRDVSRRRGEILDSVLEKGRTALHAYIPLACLFGYTSELRNFTSGTASFTMEPSHYAPVKEELADLRTEKERVAN